MTDYTDPTDIDPATGQPRKKAGIGTTAGTGLATLANTPSSSAPSYGTTPVSYATGGPIRLGDPNAPAPSMGIDPDAPLHTTGPTLDGPGMAAPPAWLPGPTLDSPTGDAALPGPMTNTTQTGLASELLNRATAAPGTLTNQAATPEPDPTPSGPTIPPGTFPPNPANPTGPMSPTAPPNPQQPGPNPTPTTKVTLPPGLSSTDAALYLLNHGVSGSDVTDQLKAAGYSDNGAYYANLGGYGFGGATIVPDGKGGWVVEKRGASGSTGSPDPMAVPPPAPPAPAPAPTPGTPALPPQTNPDGSQPTGAGTRDPRWKALYDELLARSQQSLNVDPNDPVIKSQVDAAGAQANVERTKQMQAAAERGGAYASGATEAEARSSGETVQLQQASMQAQLMSREVDARRTEIATALSSMQGILTVDEQSRLQQEDQALQARQQDLANAQAQIQNAFNARQQDETEKQNAWYRMFEDRSWESNLAQQNWQNEQSIYG